MFMLGLLGSATALLLGILGLLLAPWLAAIGAMICAQNAYQQSQS
jgi:hypothetical protein